MQDPDHLARARSLGSLDDAAALYRSWAAEYDRDVFERSGVIGSARIADLLADALHDPGVRVVDLGCGTGAVGVRLAERGLRRVVGLDLSPEMLDVAAAKGVYERLVVADLTDLTELRPQLGSFGASVSAGTFTHGHIGPGAVPELLDLLEPGGLIAWVVADALWSGFEEAFAAADVSITSADLEPIRRDADDRARMVVARRP